MRHHNTGASRKASSLPVVGGRPCGIRMGNCFAPRRDPAPPPPPPPTLPGTLPPHQEPDGEEVYDVPPHARVADALVAVMRSLERLTAWEKHFSGGLAGRIIKRPSRTHVQPKHSTTTPTPTPLTSPPTLLELCISQLTVTPQRDGELCRVPPDLLELLLANMRTHHLLSLRNIEVFLQPSMIRLDLSEPVSGPSHIPYVVKPVVLEKIARACPNLRELNLTNWWIVSSHFSSIADGCPQLSVLDLTLCSKVKDADLLRISSSCHNLSTLLLAGCNRITDDATLHISRSCPRLHCLELSWCKHITLESLWYLGQGNTPEIREVFLSCNEAVCECDELPEDGFAALEVLSLYLSKSLSETAALSVCRALPAARHLSLGMCHGITVPCMKELAQRCTRLRVLELSGNPHVTDQICEMLAQHCVDMEEIALDFCPFVSDAGLIALVEGMRNLHTVHVAGCKSLAKKALGRFVTYLDRLTRSVNIVL